MMTRADNTEAALAAIELAWAENLSADPAVAAGFTGWGALAPAFAPAPTGKWLAVADRLDDIMPLEARVAAAEQLDTSFFTAEAVTSAVFDLLRATGFTGGRVLEPGCGVGHFMYNAPADLAVEWTGVEVDPTSVRLARIVNPSANIIEGKLEHTVLRDDYFDAAVGNVPFSDVVVHDNHGVSGALHNYFIRRAANAVRPGGYIVMVTSRHTMDSTVGLGALHLDLHDTAFVGGVRLPSGAFADAGTEAVTDILVFRKNDHALSLPAHEGAATFSIKETPGYYGTQQSRVESRVEVTTPDQNAPGVPTLVNPYWAAHPEHVAGQMRVTTFQRSPLVVRADDPAAEIARAAAALAPTLPPIGTGPDLGLGDVVLHDLDGRKEGSYHLIDGAIVRVEGGRPTPARTNKELVALIGLRDLAVALLAADSNMDTPDHEITPLRSETLAAYQDYVTRFGHLNRGTLVEGRVDEESGLPALSWRRPAMGGFRRDPDAALVMALEVFDQETGEASPAPILTRRVNRRPEPVERVGTPAEALAVSVGETGRVDLDRIAGLLDLTADEARAELEAADLIFDDGGQLVSAAEFLSGDVRTKLECARARGQEREAAALEAVLPEPLGPGEINIGLGSPLVTAADVELFLSEALGASWPHVEHTPDLGLWEVRTTSHDRSSTIQYGTPDVNPGRLVECALNSRAPEVTDEVWNSARGEFVRVRNPEKSAAANEKLELIRDRFALWVWEDEERSARLCEEYNRKYNSYVLRRFDGSGLTFPGISDTVTPWAHQRSAVERIVSTPRALIGHPVGAGKTISMILSAMTLRQFGLANKPMIVVPNHLLDQVAREAQQTVPTAKILIATKDDLVKSQRRLFAARCATGDWDAVIITHSSFTAIPVHPAVEEEWVQREKFDLRWALENNDHGYGARGPKAIARALRALDTRISKLRGAVSDPDTIFFEQLGVDHILYDEAHLARRLSTGSTRRDTGFGSGVSKRATDLLVKIETLAARKGPDAPVVGLFTGTPWSNTLAETWVWQRYLQPELLRGLGLLPFDAWVSAFVRYETSIEVAPDGSGFRMQRRPAGLVNVPELKAMLGQVADILDPKTLGLERPNVTYRNLTVPASPGQRAFVQDLAARADELRAKEPRVRDNDTVDNMLLIVGDGRKVALDPRLVGVDEDSTKLLELARAVAAAYHQNRDRSFGTHPRAGGFQLVFLDLGTPKPNASQSYGRLRRALVDEGVPANTIRFVHEATTDKARAALFAACRDGEVAVLVGSTPKVGMGTNVQTRLTHLWHGDAPWLPSEVLQRNGRADRPGNLAGEVIITNVVTEGTFDAYTWQALERKSRSFDALYASSASAREVEDVSAATISYGEVKALASGNPLLMEQAKARALVKRLTMMRSVFQEGVRRAEREANSLAQRAESETRRAASLDRVVLERTETRDTARLHTTVAGWLKPGTTYGSRAHWRGVDLSPQWEKGSLARVGVQLSFSTIHEVFVSAKVLRRGASAVCEHIVAVVDEFLETAAERAEEARRHARNLKEQSGLALEAAEQAVFADEAQLQEAIAALARVDSQIADEVLTPQQAVA